MLQPWLGTSVWLKVCQVLQCGDPYSKSNVVTTIVIVFGKAVPRCRKGCPKVLLRDYFSPNVRNKKVLRICAKSGFPLNVASPRSYPPKTYFHPNVAPPVNRRR